MKLSEIKNYSEVHVYKGETFAGLLQRTAEGSIFTYDSEFLKNIANHRNPKSWISWNMPTSRKVYETKGYNLNPFFAGLLPEGLRLQALTTAIKTSPDDLFSLLVAVGSDCIGDISIKAPDAIQVKSKKKLEDLETASFESLFVRSISDNLEDRSFSIAGIQDKVSGNMIAIPLKLKRNKKQYILKIANKNFPQIIQNEHFFMNLASKCQLNVAKTEIVHDRNGITGLLIERFDRAYDPKLKKIIKFQQEDACQLLNKYPADKYRLGSGEIAKVLQEYSTSGVIAVLEFLKLKIFSYVIANGDLHAKNISLLERNGVINFSPAYDLLSTLPYGDSQMALEFDGRKDNLKGKDFVIFAMRFGVSENKILQILEELQAKFQELTEADLSQIGLSDKQTANLYRVISKRCAELA